MHFNDWHTAAGTLLLRTQYAWDRLFQDARSVLTVHNIGYQGIISAASADRGAARRRSPPARSARIRRRPINLLRTGLHYADLITTVSPTYAREIQTPEYGMGLDGVLRARSTRRVGILNGVDYDEWDPRHDRLSAAALTDRIQLERQGSAEAAAAAAARARRQRTRIAADRHASAGWRRRRASICCSRRCRDCCRARQFNLVVLGSGEARYETFFAAHAAAVPDARALSRRLQR